MTREEIIHVFEYSRLVSDNFTSDAVTAAYIEALAALRAQQEAEKNEPLTFDELLEMDGEPVFVATTAGSTWALVDVQKDKSVLLWSGQDCSLDAEMIFCDGYCCRHKPEEVQK